MNRRELFEQLEQRIPSSLSCDWDRDGIMLCTDWNTPVKRVVTCLDITEESILFAKDQKADLIISHHPFLFHPLQRLDVGDQKGRQVLSLAESGVAVFSYHTRLDAMPGGLNDRLCSLLGMKEVDTVQTGDPASLARLGLINECSPRVFAQNVANALCAGIRLFPGNRSIKKVFSVCGGGKEFLPLAQACGADAFVSGDLGYNSVLDAVEQGITVVDAGHRATELPVCELLQEIIKEICPQIQVLPCHLGGNEAWILPNSLDI